ncbi:hypothetical protein BJY59DRAFT_585657 [Rhodotorula toruloides]
MRQCFPQRWADEYPDLIPGLRDMVVSTYNDGVPLAWNDLVRTAGFVEKANELDRLIAEAQARKDAGEEPRNLYQMGLDGTITVPSATVPVLQTSISSLRQKRQALANKNAETYARIAALSQAVSAQETQNEEILTQFTEVRYRPLLAIFASPARPRCAHQTGWVRAVRKGVEGD